MGMKDHDMEDNYLWDRSGEPDPEIQELENILGRLRYQPRPLQIPHDFQTGRRRSFFPAMAIAAAIALCAIVVGLWFGFNRRQFPVSAAKQDRQIDRQLGTPPPQPKSDNPPAQTVAVQAPKRPATQRRETPHNLLAAYKSRGNRTVVREPALTPQELADKEQVLVALRLVSAKLNLAQRKTQGLPQLNSIRNQHKIG
jgi:hypothetical protein